MVNFRLKVFQNEDEEDQDHALILRAAQGVMSIHFSSSKGLYDLLLLINRITA